MITDVRGLESRSLTLRGDPESCRASAAELRALAAVTEEVAAYLLSRRDLDDGSGRWAAAYGARCRRAIDLADELAGRCRDVVTALHSAADLLDAAERDLRETRDLAAEHELLTGNRLLPPSPGSSAAVWAAWRRADELVSDVRAAEREARHGVERALETTSLEFGGTR